MTSASPNDTEEELQVTLRAQGGQEPLLYHVAYSSEGSAYANEYISRGFSIFQFGYLQDTVIHPSVVLLLLGITYFFPFLQVFCDVVCFFLSLSLSASVSSSVNVHCRSPSSFLFLSVRQG